METLKIKNICKKIFSGGTPSTQNKSFWMGSNNWLSSGETRNNYITKTEKHISNEAISNSSTKLSIKNDILIASAGQGTTRGQTSFNLINTYINQSIICLRVNEEIVVPKFLFYNLKSRYEEIRGLSDANSIRGSLTTKLIGEMSISVPNIETQQHIVDTITKEVSYAQI